MLNLWYRGAKALPFSGPTGGQFMGVNWRGILHTVEGTTFNPSTETYYGHRNPPHWTLVWADGEAKMWQHYPTDVAARSLENRAGGVQTNRQNALQIEIAWFAAEINDMPHPMWEELAKLVAWCGIHFGILPFCPPFGDQEQYGLRNTYEFDDQAWEDFNGWCGHQHVPENTHWDPGAISDTNLRRIGLAPIIFPN